ncbi:hypothetical protein CRENBAI_015066, partial [Crenichthys baileyi]
MSRTVKHSSSSTQAKETLGETRGIKLRRPSHPQDSGQHSEEPKISFLVPLRILR